MPQPGSAQPGKGSKKWNPKTGFKGHLRDAAGAFKTCYLSPTCSHQVLQDDSCLSNDSLPDHPNVILTHLASQVCRRAWHQYGQRRCAVPSSGHSPRPSPGSRTAAAGRSSAFLCSGCFLVHQRRLYSDVASVTSVSWPEFMIFLQKKSPDLISREGFRGFTKLLNSSKSFCSLQCSLFHCKCQQGSV